MAIVVYPSEDEYNFYVLMSDMVASARHFTLPRSPNTKPVANAVHAFCNGPAAKIIVGVFGEGVLQPQVSVYPIGTTPETVTLCGIKFKILPPLTGGIPIGEPWALMVLDGRDQAFHGLGHPGTTIGGAWYCPMCSFLMMGQNPCPSCGWDKDVAD